MKDIRQAARTRLERVRWGSFATFMASDALAINLARQEHLASLGLPIGQRSVLEVGAGIGLHTGFFEERGCRVVSTDGRPENVTEMRRRWPHRTVGIVDLDVPGSLEEFGHFDICYCYGTLYHLAHPEEALRGMAAHSDLLLLETCVSFGDGDALNPVGEDAATYSQATSGIGCRPTRLWLMNRLRRDWGHAYMSVTQPAYPDFVTDWTQPRATPSGNVRAVFVASREPIDNPLLTDRVVDRHHHV